MNISVKVGNELLFIINQFPESVKKQLDSSIIEILKSTYYNFDIYSRYDSDKPFTKQEFEEDTLKILNALILEMNFDVV